ncbi:hypothetical protein HMPREF0971_03151 [Segatella oris F0302]|uniref:Uncharacterized protein n=1 Tax=Segatella oris F0302 TaxID=649760 RepID=D1QVW0_9BACT|nr:hypothetical protein HMPREF0971_03151 [Segatella oris F0302]
MQDRKIKTSNSELRNGATRALKVFFYFYLVGFGNVKYGIRIFTE